MFRFRKLYPLGRINRKYTAPLFPVIPVVTMVIVIAGIFGLHLNYGINLIACTLFYFLASLWFLVRRYQFVDKAGFMRAGLDRWNQERQAGPNHRIC
jgi:ethanolamine permease